MKIFVYGTLKQGQGNHTLLRNAKYLGEASIEGFDMYDLGWYPGIVLGHGTVKGEVYSIDSEILKSLDRLEGYHGEKYMDSNLYNRVIVEHPEHGAMYTYVYNGMRGGIYQIESGEWE